MRRLKAIGAALLALLMPKAFGEKDKTLRPENRIPESVLKYGWGGYPYPEDNPYIGTKETYLRHQWDHNHGWYDYS